MHLLMIDNGELDYFHADTLEIHYWFLDDSHTMDANIENKCGLEILGIIKEVSRIFSLEVSIETGPITEGGLKKWLRLISKEENKKAPITVAVIVSLVTTLLVTPLSKISEKVIENIFEDTELSELKKEKLRLEIKKLKQEISQNDTDIESNILIKKKKSNFYEELERYPKIEKVSFTVTDDNNKEQIKSKEVHRSGFKEYILVSDDLEPLKKEDAIIEIISPVLKKGHYKWTGYYNGEPISFNMNSNEFKTSIQNGEVEFKNGSSINCSLQIRRRIDNEGIEKIVGYDVVRVNSYFENDKPIETKEGRQHRQFKEAQKKQLNIFDHSDNDEPKFTSDN